jgi:hypothetical protein
VNDRAHKLGRSRLRWERDEPAVGGSPPLANSQVAWSTSGRWASCDVPPVLFSTESFTAEKVTAPGTHPVGVPRERVPRTVSQAVLSPRRPGRPRPVLRGSAGWTRCAASRPLVVVFDHLSYSFMAEFRRELMPEFNAR